MVYHLVTDALVRDAPAWRVASLADARHLAAIRDAGASTPTSTLLDRLAGRSRRTTTQTPAACPC